MKVILIYVCVTFISGNTESQRGLQSSPRMSLTLILNIFKDLPLHLIYMTQIFLNIFWKR
jgi:hypothetical protein